MSASTVDSKEDRLILDSIPHLVWVAAPDGAIEFLNKPCLEFTGLPMGDLLGWDWEKLIHPEDLHATLAAWTHALKTGTPLESECRMRRADGVYRWFVNRGKPLVDADGKVLRWFGTCSDITDRKNAEGGRRKSEEIFRAIVEHSHEGFALLGPDQSIRYVSPAVTRILGYYPESLLGSHISDHVHPDDMPGWQTWITYLVSQPGERIEVWYRFRHRDGSYHRLEVRATNLLAEPDVQAIVVNFWTISDVKTARV